MSVAELQAMRHVQYPDKPKYDKIREWFNGRRKIKLIESQANAMKWIGRQLNASISTAERTLR